MSPQPSVCGGLKFHVFVVPYGESCSIDGEDEVKMECFGYSQCLEDVCKCVDYMDYSESHQDCIHEAGKSWWWDTSLSID